VTRVRDVPPPAPAAPGDALRSADAARPGEGLVTCATTARVSESADQGRARELRFPTADLVSAAASIFTRRARWEGSEGPRPLLTVAPGVVSISWPDVARRERSAERAEQARRARVGEVARYAAEYVDTPLPPESVREVTEWSRKSRARMTRTLAELGYDALLRMGLRLPMTTLTYPGDWETVAPSGTVAKRHLSMLFKRFVRAWGFEWLGIWKIEFQRRGAPHFHLWGPEPEGTAGELRRMTQLRYRPAVGDGLPYREWLSAVWADVVAHPDPEQRRRHLLAGTAVDHREGERMRDPRRLAIYFTKHGQYRAKEYQHQVPELWQAPGSGPGRFWGYRGLDRATAGVELEPVTAVWAGRILRRYARAQGVNRQVTVRRIRGGRVRLGVNQAAVVGLAGAELVSAYEASEPGRTRYRTVRRPVVRLGNGRGFLCVNDGPGLAGSLARALDPDRSPPPSRERAWGRLTAS
jgi:hypothetical protein